MTALKGEYYDLDAPSIPTELVYGPVTSRRLGQSLGINLLGKQKICSFDCAYCDLGLTQIRLNQLKKDSLFPTPEEVEKALRQKLQALADKNITFDALTVSGNGEPTLHPDFLGCTEAIQRVRQELQIPAKLVVLTNGVHCDNRRVLQGLGLYDECMIKIDAGSERTYKLLNRPLVRADLTKIAGGARRLKEVIVQSLFIQGAIDNTTKEEVDDWLEVVGIIKPKAIHLYTISRVPPVSGLIKASEDTLYTIASKVKRKLQIECLVF